MLAPFLFGIISGIMPMRIAADFSGEFSEMNLG
jgi:hypothetical protein